MLGELGEKRISKEERQEERNPITAKEKANCKDEGDSDNEDGEAEEDKKGTRK